MRRRYFTVAERLTRAAEWVMDLDAQYRDLIHAGRSPKVNIPAASNPRVGRVQRVTLERDLEDLATLLSLVAPARFAPADGKLHPSSLRSRARPYVLRRRKQEVLKELPPVLDTVEMLDLSEAQERAYRDTVKQYRRRGESPTV